MKQVQVHFQSHTNCCDNYNRIVDATKTLPTRPTTLELASPAHQTLQPRQVKTWHVNITAEMRQQLIQKIIKTINPTQDPKIHSDPRLNELVNFAIRTECDFYETVKDQEDYFHLLRTYNIKKYFEEKQKAVIVLQPPLVIQPSELNKQR